MDSFGQWCRFLGWQTQALMEREGIDVGPLPASGVAVVHRTPRRRPSLLRALLGRTGAR